MTIRPLILLLLVACWAGGGRAWAEVAARYDASAGSPDPATAVGGAWTLNNPGTVNGSTVISAALAPDSTTGLNAWRMLDNTTAGSQFAFWSKGLTAGQLGNAAANGWRLSANLRVVDPVAANGGAASVVLLYGDNAGKRWILFFDLDASGNLTANLFGSSTITVATGASATAYHRHELVYNPATQSVEYLVDGISKATGYAGTTGSFNGVQWGNGSTNGRGDSYWNDVAFTIQELTPPLPAATTQPTSQAVAPGTSVTLSGAFTNAMNFQWYKDTAPVAGATSATLVLGNVAAAASGEYWLRASNATGSSETTTAALEVLTPGAALRLTEFVAENDGGIRDADGQQQDWIELHNPSTTPASTANWKLTDRAAPPATWALPDITLPPGGYLVIFASGKNRALAGAELHTDFKISNAGGGYLALVRPDGGIESAFAAYPAQTADVSYGLTLAGAAKYFRTPTPGGPNVDGSSVLRPEPTFFPPAGTFSGTLNVTISSPLTEGTLRYSVNGQRPTFDSPAVSGPVVLAASTNLRAAVLYLGERYGGSASAAYLRVGADASAFTSPLPIVILHNFGAGAVPGVASSGPNGDGSNVVEMAKQPASMTILDAATGATTLSSPVVHSTRAGVKLRGSSSFSFARKSYTLETWGEINEQGRDEPLLGLPADNDWALYAPNPTQFDDALIHNSLIYELARQAGYPAPRTRFVEVFLNTGGGDVTMANALGLYLLVEKPKRAKDRVDFAALNADGTAGGWMIHSDRMDGLPPGSTVGSVLPRHFHTAGPDRSLQTEDDNARGYQGPGGGSGIAPPRDDLPNYYHSFFNFESPGGWDITPAQRAPIEAQLRAFDAALYGASYADPVAGYAPHIDRAAWAQFLALQCFAKNQDAVVLSTYFYRETPAARIKTGPLWDFDRAFASNGSATASPTWAHDRLYYPRLMSDPEFTQAYIDAWQAMRRGPFTNANLTALVDAQSAEITSAVAARSGTTTTQWAADLTTLKTWLNDRAAAMDALYTSPAVFSQPGGSVGTPFTLGMTAPAGTIYYTTNGTDPRLPGGAIAAGATAYSGPVPISASTTVFARVKNGATWSGTTIGTYFPPQDLQTLRVTEIYYNPPGSGAVDGDEFEFLELQNTGPTTLELGGLSFSGITFTFPTGTTLAPGAFFLLARNAAQLATRFSGVTVHGIYTGKLSNDGETLSLLQGAGVVWSFAYGTSGAWPAEANNGGLSLQRPEPAALGYDPATWTAATPTPGGALPLTDSDGDGLPDYWESLYALGSAGADADGDGRSNRAEYDAGTNPRDPGSVFKLIATPQPDGTSLNLAFQALAARSYTVQYSDDLAAGPWLKYCDVAAGPQTRNETITVPIETTRRYFRVITPAVAGLALLAPAGGNDAVTLDALFSDHMVLQREAKLPVWGTAAAGHEITVTFNGASAGAVADAQGRWRAELPAQVASTTARELQISANGTPLITVGDVLVGEVWLCAGQSNMEFRTDQEATWAGEQANAALPHVRLRNLGYAGQGIFASAYSAAVVARQTPEQFYNAGTWAACNAASAAPFSAVGYFFGKEIRAAVGVPVGLINVSVGGSPAEAWVRRGALAGNAALAPMVNPNWTTSGTALEPWCNERARVQLGANAGTAPGDDLGPNHSFKPAFLWNAGPARIAPFAIRGVLWYQGESNALSHLGEAGVTNPRWRVDQHEQLFPMLVRDWRHQWGQGDFPFLVCQLSSISESAYDSDFWPEFRDGQRRAARLLPNVGLAVTSDLGNATNVHPTNKRDVGRRLACWARRNIYGEPGVLACPLPTSATRQGNVATVLFSDAGPALATSNGAAPASLEVAGADGVFHAATASIAGATVLASSPNVPAPTAVRYGWQPFSNGNLVNSAGLPASTFQLTITL
jgi:sialate O-acetylesterase